MVEVALTVALLLPMMVLFGLTAGMGFPFYLIVLGITILFPVIPGLLGTMFGTQIYRILKNSSARIARLKAVSVLKHTSSIPYSPCIMEDTVVMESEEADRIEQSLHTEADTA